MVTQQKVLKVVIVEDENLWRDLLVASLTTVSNLTVVGAYADGGSAFANVKNDDPDVALLDVNLGHGWNGVETGIELRKVKPSLGIVLLSNYARPEILTSLPPSALPGWSYLLKRTTRDLQTVVRAIEGSAANLVVLDPELVKPTNQKNPLNGLTPRQAQILSLVAQGYTNQAISRTLFLSEKSVEHQLTAIYGQIGLKSPSNEHHARVKAALLFALGQQPNG